MPPMATELMLGEKLEFERTRALRGGLEAGLRLKVGERPQTMRAFLETLEQPTQSILAREGHGCRSKSDSTGA